MLSENLPRKKVLIFGVVILGILILLLISLLRQRKQIQDASLMTDQNGYNNTENNIPQITPEFQSVSSPQMSFKNYNTASISVTLPNQVKTYSFMSDYSLPSLAKVGEKLGLSESKTEGNSVIFYNNEDEQYKGYLTYNTLTGNYVYLSYGKYPLPQSGTSVTSNVQSFLLSKNLIDNTVDCNITYQRLDVQNTTFVECHRDWQKAGLPIIQIVGLLNVPDLKKITDLQVGMVDDESVQSNQNIINVSTGQNGMERPSDFNTLTAAVDNNGNLVGITSNLKMVENSTAFTQSDLITPDEALNILKENNNLQFSLVVPVDDNMAWTTVFPDNQAPNLDAQITDILLTYIENPFAGKSLTPMYLAKGTATTQEGYAVKFLQAIPALKNQQAFENEAGYNEIESDEGDVAGLMAQAAPTDDPTLKLKTFEPDQKSTSRSIALNGLSCVPAESQLSPIISLGTLGTLGKWTINAPSPQDVGSSGPFRWFRSGQWYLIPTNPQVLPEISSVVSAFEALPLEGRSSNVRELSNLQNEWNKYNLCPLRVSGGSPTLFAYGNNKYNINVNKQLTYSYPNATNGGWTINGNTGKTIYYEYQTVKFDKPQSGWNINKLNLDQFVTNLGSKLGLTQAETSKLYFEINLAAQKLPYESIFIGPISQNEVDAKVPLTVSPKSKITRYHYFVTKPQTGISSPNTSPIVRSSEMILELGAVAQ